MVATVLSIDTIVSDPKIRGGRPIIAGTGIRVIDIVAYYRYGGQTPEELATGFALSLGQVHAALAYYHLHKDEIDESMRAEAERAEQLIAELEKQGKVDAG
ncbi:MAG: DUF433 domain-containing protein [Chloroflexi bacterium]|nr:MAG: DUF433 domain-containing protein [Chloroflexota bacterium]